MDLRLRSLDRIVTALIVALIVATPLALGSVYPWPAALIQVAVAALIIICAIKIAAGAGAQDGVTFPQLFPFITPAVLLAGLLVIQLIPMPPRMLLVLSPHTYQVYTKALPGWPRMAPYSDKAFFAPSAPPSTAAVSTLLPTVQEVRHGTPVPFAGNAASVRARKTDIVARRAKTDASARRSNQGSVFPATWRPLAISPALTTTAILRFAAYAGLFFVVVAYPFADGEKGEQRFYRSA
ncbi:MAG TPA: hypothetical protein VJ718_06185, partial [Candidatus Binataceae bacterium]|nr:hypothetical protein [Candidatus Binataceae bacterium]